MPTWLEHILPELIFWGSILSVISVLLTLLGVPWVIARLPADYFSEPRRHPMREEGNPGRLLATALKNVLGAALVVLGVLLIFTPGQGLITILAGLLLMNFPGKYRLERAVVAREGVFKALNWFRRRGGHPPFEPPRH